jgi:hypothetical protein
VTVLRARCRRGSAGARLDCSWRRTPPLCKVVSTCKSRRLEEAGEQDNNAFGA